MSAEFGDMPALSLDFPLFLATSFPLSRE